MEDDQQRTTDQTPVARPRPRPVRPAADVAPPARPAPSGPVRTRVKICGITRLEDAELAIDAGAWAVGLIFYRGSKRRCRIEEAQRIGAALKRRVEIVGVFVNATLDEVARTVDQVGLTIVQLHGDEGPSYCAEVERRTGAKVIKAARVRTGSDVTALRTFHTDFHLLDTHVAGTPGGTGETFDWELARVRRGPGEGGQGRQPPLILSGGLRPENVAEAVRTATPFAVDVASGTETVPGRKDPERVRAFVREVRRAFDDEEAAASARTESTPTAENR